MFEQAKYYDGSRYAREFDLWYLRQRSLQRIKNMYGTGDEETPSLSQIREQEAEKELERLHRLLAQERAQERAQAADDYTVNVKSTIKVKK